MRPRRSRRSSDRTSTPPTRTAPARRVVEPRHEGGQGALARSRGTDDGRDAAGLAREADALEHEPPFGAGVGERDARELAPAVRAARGPGRRAPRSAGRTRGTAPRTARWPGVLSTSPIRSHEALARTNDMKHARDHAEGEQDLAHVVDERDGLPDLQGGIRHPEARPSRAPRRCRGSPAAAMPGPKSAMRPQRPRRGGGELAVRDGEPPHLVLLLAEGLHHPDAAEVLARRPSSPRRCPPAPGGSAETR